MTFKRLTMVEKSTGKETVLFDGESFQNFDYLKKIVGNDFVNLNDDLMDGISESNGYSTERSFDIYDCGKIVDTLLFLYEPDTYEANHQSL